MDESLEGLAWLLSQLQGNATVSAAITGGVWPIQAPEGTATPYAVVTSMGGRDVQGVAGYRLMYEGQFQVTFWGDATQSDTLKSAANATDAMLQPGGIRSQGSTATATILSCLRDHPLPIRPDWIGQSLRIGVGALWRLQIRAN